MSTTTPPTALTPVGRKEQINGKQEIERDTQVCASSCGVRMAPMSEPVRLARRRGFLR